LLVVALGIFALLSWYAGGDLMFVLTAKRASAEVIGWNVTMERWGVEPGQANIPARTGIAPVPRVELSLLGQNGRRCLVQGRRAVFGLREMESEQQMKDALAQLQAGGTSEAFVRERGTQIECRLSRAVDPSLAAFWLAVAAFVSLLIISMWRARRAAQNKGGEANEGH
jgi:hypothetical protein